MPRFKTRKKKFAEMMCVAFDGFSNTGDRATLRRRMQVGRINFKEKPFAKILKAVNKNMLR
jgi:hypothetical protein